MNFILQLLTSKKLRFHTGIILALTFLTLLSGCKPSYEEKEAANRPKFMAILAKHKDRIFDYKNKLLALRDTLNYFDTSFVSTAKLDPILRTGSTGAPENLLFYNMKELEDVSSASGYDHYGMICPGAFNYAIYFYDTTNYFNYDQTPEEFEQTFSDFSVEKYPYALIFNEVGREDAKLEGSDSFTGGTVTVKVYLVDMRTNTVLGYERIYGEAPEFISTRYKTSEGKEVAFQKQINEGLNASVERSVIEFLRKFKDFIYNYDERDKTEP